MGRAKNLKEKLEIEFYDPRDFTEDAHKTVDDRPFGGGPGMVLKALPVLKAVEKARKDFGGKGEVKTKIITLSPRGRTFERKYARKCARTFDHIILISGRYEGIDSRVNKILSAEEVSIGDYTLSGGEIPAMVVVDAVSRQIPGVLGNEESIEEGRTSSGEMYTRPDILEWEGEKYSVPDVLLSGDHAKIEEWRKGGQI